MKSLCLNQFVDFFQNLIGFVKVLKICMPGSFHFLVFDNGLIVAVNVEPVVVPVVRRFVVNAAGA